MIDNYKLIYTSVRRSHEKLAVRNRNTWKASKLTAEWIVINKLLTWLPGAAAQEKWNSFELNNASSKSNSMQSHAKWLTVKPMNVWIWRKISPFKNFSMHNSGFEARWPSSGRCTHVHQIIVPLRYYLFNTLGTFANEFKVEIETAVEEEVVAS